MGGDSSDDFQRQALELLKVQHEAYLKAVKTWTDSVVAVSAPPSWPEPPALDTLPNPAEMAEVSAKFAARIFEEQSRFMKELSETLAAAPKKS
jgi:hypothetical protein